MVETTADLVNWGLWFSSYFLFFSQTFLTFEPLIGQNWLEIQKTIKVSPEKA